VLTQPKGALPAIHVLYPAFSWLVRSASSRELAIDKLVSAHDMLTSNRDVYVGGQKKNAKGVRSVDKSELKVQYI
jgi:hypothetical protein